jgi:hypothetical protein
MVSIVIKKNLRKTAKSFARKPAKRYRRRVKKTPEKAKDEEKLEKVGLYMSAKAAHELRVAAAMHRKRISELAEELIVEGLARLAEKR